MPKCLLVFDGRANFFFSSRSRHTRLTCDWSSDVCSSDLFLLVVHPWMAADAERMDDEQEAAAGAVGAVELGLPDLRSEERRVGKEWRSRRSPDHEEKNRHERMGTEHSTTERMLRGYA